MEMKKTTFFVIFLLLLCLNLEAAVPKIAVLPFKMGRVERWWNWNWEVTQGVEDLVVGELVRSGAMQVVERERLEQILGEQKLGKLGVLDPKTVAEAGKVLGVQYLLLGTVTDFTIDDGGVRLPLVGKYTKTTARVALDARLVDTETAAILAAVSGRGEESQSGFALGSVFGSLEGLAFDSQRFQNHILGIATNNAVEELVRNLTFELRKLPQKSQSCLVADVAGERVILNQGSSAGVQVGQRYRIQKKLREVTDPLTGEVIFVEEETVAEAEVIQVTERAAVALLRNVAGKVEVGQKAIRK